VIAWEWHPPPDDENCAAWLATSEGATVGDVIQTNPEDEADEWFAQAYAANGVILSAYFSDLGMAKAWVEKFGTGNPGPVPGGDPKNSK
jgi:hypothetical protein